MHAEVLRIRGRIEEAFDYLSALGSPDLSQIEICAAHKMHRGYCSGLLGHFEDSIKLLREAEDLAVAAGSPELLGEAYLRQAMIQFLLKDYDAASFAYKAVLDISNKIPGWYLHSSALAGIGKISMIRGHYADAIPLFEEAFTITEKAGACYRMSRLWSELAVCYLGLDDSDKALELFRKAERAMLEFGAIPNYQVVIANIGNVYLQRGDYMNAIENYQQALAMAREIKDPASIRKWTHNINLAYAKMRASMG